MTIGSKQFKSGKVVGLLQFDSGKRVFLNGEEWREFESRLRLIEEVGREKERADRAIKSMAGI